MRRPAPSRRRSTMAIEPKSRARPTMCTDSTTGYAHSASRMKRPRPVASTACMPVGMATESAKLDGLAADRDALGAHLLGLVAIRIADDGRRRADLQRLARQSAVVHPRRRRQHRDPRLRRRPELHVTVRMLVAGLLDRAGERQRLARVVFAPAVMRERGH